MTRQALLIGLSLWVIDLIFVIFMIVATDIDQHPFFWPLIIGLLIVLLPVNLFVAGRMPGAR